MTSEREQVVTSIVVIKAALVNKNDEILFLKRSSENKTDVGKWEFPGGKLEKGQLTNEVLIRELQEEVGVDIADRERNSLAHVYSQHAEVEGYEDITIVTLTYMIRSEGEDITLSHEHDDYKWVSKENALELDLREATRKTLTSGDFI